MWSQIFGALAGRSRSSQPLNLLRKQRAEALAAGGGRPGTRETGASGEETAWAAGGGGMLVRAAIRILF